MPDNRKVAIFWDYENCAPPLSSQAYAIVNGIRRIAHIFGSVTTFKTYLDLSEQPSRNSVVFRSDLQSSGVSVIDCPHNGRKDVVDKMILVDMLAFAIDHESPATIVLIAGDRDYAYAMSTLRLRQYSVVLIAPSAPNIPQSLKSQASVVVDWNYAILRKRPDADTPPVWQPYRDLGEDIVERLAREIQDPNEDPAVTLISSHHAPTVPTHTRHISAAEPLEPPVFQRNTDSSDAAQPAPVYTPKKAPSIFPGTPGHFSVGSGSSRARSATIQSSHTNSSDDIQPAWRHTTQKAAIASTDMPGGSGVGSAMWRARSATQAIPDIGRDSAHTENIALSDGSVAKECVSTANDIWDVTYDPFAITSPLQRYQYIAEPGSPPIVNFRNYPSSPPPTTAFNLGSTTTPLHSSSHSRTISGGTPVSFGNLPQRIAPTAAPLSPEPMGGPGEATTAPESTNTGSDSDIMDDSIVPANHAALMHALGLSDDEEDEDEDDYSSDENASGSTSPVLIEVDNPSPVDDVVESYLNGGRPSPDDTAMSPPIVNTSPPITETSGTPSSQESSLAPSSPRLNASMPNVGAGLPQATFVISDNINNHSSGYQALPIESVEAKIQRITPAQFLPLIKLLLLARSNRNMRPGRSMIAEALRQYGDVYKRAGVNTFKDYSMLAQQASLIELGGREGDAWIALHPNLFKDKTNAQKSPTPSTVLNNSFFASQGNVRTSTATTPPSSSASQSTIPESVEDKIRRITPAQFLPLINQLLLARSKGNTKPGRSTIADALSQCDKDVYKRAGVNKFKDYSMLAQQASLIKLGGWEGDAWIALHPNLFKDKTIASKSPTPSTVLNNSSSAPQGNVRTSTATIPPSSSASQSTISNTNTSHLPNNEPIPRHFYPLMDYLARVGRAGLTKPLRSSVGLALGPGVYATAGASSLKEYLALAVRVGAVECGGSDSYAWVRLHPDVRADGRRPI